MLTEIFMAGVTFVHWMTSESTIHPRFTIHLQSSSAFINQSHASQSPLLPALPQSPYFTFQNRTILQ